MLAKILRWHRRLSWSWGSIFWISSCPELIEAYLPNAVFAMSCCQSMPHRVPLHSYSLLLSCSTVSVPKGDWQTFQEILAQTYAQSHTLHCCVALQWHKERLQPRVVHHCKLNSFINANAAAYICGSKFNSHAVFQSMDWAWSRQACQIWQVIF